MYEQPFVCSPYALVSLPLFLRNLTSPSPALSFVVLMRVLVDNVAFVPTATLLIFVV
jgi:hypothetical protein